MVMEEWRREILNRVAAGTLTPEEAAEQLAELEREGARGARREEVPGLGAIRYVRIAKRQGPVEVIGDSSVREAVAEGRHVARRVGDSLVIEGEDDEGVSGFAFSRSERGGFHFGFGRENQRLLVRMNPLLALEVELQAGSCRVRGVKGPIQADLQAGSTMIDGFAGPLRISHQAGSVRANGRLDHGASHIRCEAGAINLYLEHGSSVRVIARSTLGRINLPDGTTITGAGSRELSIGDGRATLELETIMGAVNVSAGQ